MGRRHNTHFLAYGAFAMLTFIVMAKQGCFAQHPLPNRPTQVR